MASGNSHGSPREIPTMDLMNTEIEMAVASLKFIKSKFLNDNLYPATNAHAITYEAHLYMLDYATCNPSG